MAVVSLMTVLQYSALSLLMIALHQAICLHILILLNRDLSLHNIQHVSLKRTCHSNATCHEKYILSKTKVPQDMENHCGYFINQSKLSLS